MFTSTFLLVLISLGLVWTALGAITLVVLLIRDFKRNQLW